MVGWCRHLQRFGAIGGVQEAKLNKQIKQIKQIKLRGPWALVQKGGHLSYTQPSQICSLASHMGLWSLHLGVSPECRVRNITSEHCQVDVTPTEKKKRLQRQGEQPSPAHFPSPFSSLHLRSTLAMQL